MSLFDSFSDFFTGQTGSQMQPNPTGGTGGTDPYPYLMGAGILGDLGNAYVGYQNYQLSKEQLKYQKGLQKDIFEREDNSVQRRVADLRAAGLSPVLAAGQGASAGAVVSTKAPQIGEMPQFAQHIMGLLQMKENIENTISQRKLIEQQVNQSKATEKQALSSARVNDKVAGLKNIELGNASLTGNAGTSLPGKMFNDLTGATTKAFDTLINSTDATIKELKEKAERFNKPTYSDEYYQIKRTNNKPRR